MVKDCEKYNIDGKPNNCGNCFGTEDVIKCEIVGFGMGIFTKSVMIEKREKAWREL